MNVKIKLNFSSALVKANSFKPTLCQYNTPRTLRIYYLGRVACYKERLLSPVGALFLSVKNRIKDILFKCYYVFLYFGDWISKYIARHYHSIKSIASREKTLAHRLLILLREEFFCSNVKRDAVVGVVLQRIHL